VETASWPRLLGIGAAAGLLSGLLGVGGGIVIVPMLVLLAGFSQHHAHATSLLAVIPIATVGAITYGVEGEVDLAIAALLATGALVGAPLGARWMAEIREGTLTLIFGCLLLAIGIFLTLP
jgi:uncharacterized membrane protein YfcA